MKERFRNFMRGRYGEGGLDDLSRFLLAVCFILVLLSLFTGGRLHSLFDALFLVAVFFTYYRLFSRDISRRYGENQQFLSATANLRRRWNREKNLMRQRKDYHIYSCPGCGQKIRMPRGRGRVEISCPKCHTKFVKNA